MCITSAWVSLEKHGDDISKTYFRHSVYNCIKYFKMCREEESFTFYTWVTLESLEAYMICLYHIISERQNKNDPWLIISYNVYLYSIRKKNSDVSGTDLKFHFSLSTPYL